MRALISAIGDLSAAARSAVGSVEPGGRLEVPDIDFIVIAVEHALTSVRVLDLEIYQRSDESAYVALRGQQREGDVVRGLTAPRNASTHSHYLIEPDLRQAVGPIDDRFVLFPVWKARADVPADAFNKTSQGVLEAYDRSVAGRHLQDTLLDAVSFFDSCDRRVVRRDDEGQIEGLPLAPLPVPRPYYRLAPDWPSHEEFAARVRSRLEGQPPGGRHRTITGYLSLPSEGLVLCGSTALDDATSTTFTERWAQVSRDIEMGYRYCLEGDNDLRALSASAGALFLSDSPLTEDDLADLGHKEPWQGWAQLALSDVDFYSRQRQPGQ